MFLLTIKTLISFKTTVPLEDKSKFERKGYLVFLLACVTLSIRMIVWPWFYFMLQSFVSEIPGQCACLALHRFSRPQSPSYKSSNPSLFLSWAAGCYVITLINLLPQRHLPGRTYSFFSSSAACFLADGVGDIYYVIRMKPLMSVSCCATFFDVPLRPSAMIPQAIFGGNFQKILFFVYYLTNIILIALLFTSMSKQWVSVASLPRKIVLYSQYAMGIINIPVVIYTFIENIAPKLMLLPYHHCIYCFMGNGMVPDAPIILGLFVIGTFAIGWMGILRLLCKNGEAQLITERLLLKVNNLSAFCLLASAIMITIHLILI